ncbi:TadE/TadG family type IV pilus assembly protein [Blastopirellula marina]|uniref:TadE/TadG family type IV pilus assembly protein n=1 Tax=Blastopirellula marina TaxID=124 RepID=UPI0021BC46A9|nr:TadE/TadG family type IV pilus assembly protein [Blastopirellula marina]
MVLELVLTLPILLILLLAIVEFYLLYSNLPRLEAASRAGAIAASRISLPAGGNVPSDVIAAVDRQLETLNLPGRQIILLHDTAGGTRQLTAGTTYASPTELTDSLPNTRNYVRVSVQAPMTGLTPNLLKTFGMDISGRIVSQISTHPHRTGRLHPPHPGGGPPDGTPGGPPNGTPGGPPSGTPGGPPGP